MKTTIRTILVMILLALLTACGGTTSSDSATTTDEGRLITGTIETADADAMLVKAIAAEDSTNCVNEICGIAAENTEGEQVQGEIDPETNLPVS